MLNAFNSLCEKLGVILPDRLSVFDIASEIYADLQKKGKLIEDADLLIASMAKTWEMILVSDDKHFQRIQGLRLENWIREEQ
ncbi:MAG: twitching motility protein PilT [bacterium]